jgi:hypothetical protein
MALGIRPAVAVAQALLMRQERRTLHEEHRERRHADITDRIGHVRSVTRVRERLAARAQALDQALEAVHAWVESYRLPVSIEPIDTWPRILGWVWHLRLTHTLVRGQKPGHLPRRVATRLH